ncbi:MAG: ribonuclease II, partial [Blastocatellia bacterium]
MKYIDHHSENILAIARQTMIAEGFKPDIPPTVIREAEAAVESDVITQNNARDLRSLLWSSIDNLSSRDLDQVEFVEKIDDGRFRVLIGIADVDAFVSKGSPADEYALENTTSVYTGVTTFPMLPEDLSTNKSSLLQDQDRLAIVIEFLVDNAGALITRDVYRAVVRNYSKMSYEIVGKWLDKQSEVPDEVSRVPKLEDQVRLQFDAAINLKSARTARGALNLETIQATPVVNSSGDVVDLALDEQNSARDLIENFMIAANAAMAEFLDSRGAISLRRVVRTPQNWPRIVEIAAELKETLPSEPDVRALAEFLDRRKRADPEHFADLSLAIVKLLGPGDYVVQVPGEQNEGHFGLAVHRYTHSTAPNRRYPDLVTQRLLKSSV